MAIIYSYPDNYDLLSSDMLVGTSTKMYMGKPRQETKNFTLDALSFFTNHSGYNTLNTVLTNGNTSLVDANVGDLGVWDAVALSYAKIKVSNSEFGFYSPNYPLTPMVSFGYTSIVFNDMDFTSTISTGAITANRTYTLPNASGTIALAGDVPDPITLTTIGTSGVATLIGDVLNIPNYSATAATPTLDEVLTAGDVSEINAYFGGEIGLYDTANLSYCTINAFDSSFTFNNSLGDPVLYSEQGVLAISKSSTIAGTIQTNLLSASRNYSLPNASGTIALTSDIPSLAGYVQTTRTLTINGTTYDLSANRTWNVGTVTEVLGAGLITSTGGNSPIISTLIHTNVLVGRSTAGTGAMEEITIGSGLTLSSGTLSATSTGGGIPHATAAGTDTYTATVASVTSYADGDAYLVRFTNGNTTGATLNINGLGAIPLYRNNDGAVIGGDIWDGAEMLCVYNSTTTAFQCIGTSSNSLFAYVTNADSVDITKGQPVYAFGGQGDRLTVKRAFNTSDATSAQTVGVVLTSSIAVNQKGIIIIQGLLDGLNILPTSTWADGDPVYLGTTAGSITNVKQYAPNHLVYLGTVTTASNGSAGRWYVRVQNGYELDELHNVQAQSPSLKDTLWYDSGVTPGQWKTASIPTILGYTPVTDARTISTTSPLQGGGDLSANRTLSILQSGSAQDGYLSSTDWNTFNNKFTLPYLTSGSVLFSNGTTIAEDNSKFFWDNTNKRLGIGLANPYTSLTIQDSSYTQILLKSTTGVEGIESFAGGILAKYDITSGGTYQYGPLTMLPSVSFITYAGYEVLTGNITTGYIPRKAPIGVENSLIYDSGTNIGIGTTSPSGKLHVNGSMYLQDSVTGIEYITFSNGPQIEAHGPAEYFKSGQVYTHTSTNFVGIGTPSPITELEVVGVITATGGNSTSWNAKQDALVSGTNIKTINGNDILGSGNLTISGASGGIHAQKFIVSGQYTNLYLSYSGTPTTQVATANRLYCMPFFPNQTFTTQSLGIDVSTLFAGGLAKVLIFSDVDGIPTTKLYESADFDCSTTGNKTASVTFTFTAGTTYWLGFVANNGTNVFRFLSQGSVYGFSTSAGFSAATHGYIAVTYNSIPTTIGALAYQGGNIPMVAIRKA